ncbi:M12 family metallopeptidase [Cryptosporangium japonicum]|uniref:Peptidase M12A domain-containing protein n=1 Tax=Cryptosporangium japonicum TaxID=80872 RepID=A0ABP3E8P4_9ACTN
MSETGVGYVYGQTFGARRVVFSVRDGRAIFEGDIVLGPVPEVSARSAVAVPGESFRWPDGVIPYEIDPALPEEQRSAVEAAVEHWNTRTRLAVVPRDGEDDYVRFVPGGGCTSSVGRQGGMQTLDLGTGCFFGQATHELGHTAGLWHEQSREDRDEFVRIVWDNIDPGQKHNFDQHITDGDDVGPYDYGSIMHYPAVSFSINGEPTIVPLLDGAEIGQREALSAGDRAAIRELYSSLEPSDANTWVGSFGVLYHLRSRGTYHLGSLATGALTWTEVGHGGPGPVGDFDGDGLDEVLDAAGGRIGRLVEGRLSWSPVTARVLGPQSWVGRFRPGGPDEVLTYYPTDNSWWLGSSEWSYAGNTEGFTADISTLLVGDVDADGVAELLVADQGEWWCAKLGASGEFEWSVVGESAGRALGVTSGGLLVTTADSTLLGSLVDGALTWRPVGAAGPPGRLVGGRFVTSPDGVWSFDGTAWTSLDGAAGDVAWALGDGRVLTYSSLDASCRLYTPGAGWSLAATFEA